MTSAENVPVLWGELILLGLQPSVLVPDVGVCWTLQQFNEDPSNPGPCSDIYPGSEAFSEPEVQAMADFLTANPQITSYLTIHAYGTMLMYPWGWTNALPPQAPELTWCIEDRAPARRRLTKE
ncbi:hypothetical protein B566_EDAN016624 [Ephemera danica]|nr:hypothetical protein B566_EDAN016624 [Ephemera danica]